MSVSRARRLRHLALCALLPRARLPALAWDAEPPQAVAGTLALLVDPASRIVVARTTNLGKGPVKLERARELRAIFAAD